MSLDESESERVRRERDLYLGLLELGGQDELEPFLESALALVVDVTGAQQGYLSLIVDDGESEEGVPDTWSIAHGFSDGELEKVRETISRGIVASTLATGETIVTSSALLDPRFNTRESVRRVGIEAVLCAPIGRTPPRGVLYLQAGREPGLFSADDQGCAEVFANHLAPLVDQVLSRVRERRVQDETAVVRKRMRLDEVVGRSAALARVLEQAAMVAPLDVNVLLTGESGTGKTQLAQVIHANGKRATRPFVDVNCAALPETLIESELFGAEAGAHSTATRATPGKVAAAQGGTLFLDEIGELPLASQAKLLQLLQSRRYYPLGASRPREADVRVIAATNLDLEQAVAEKRFREDLFFRLQVLPIRLPSLMERREDIPLLARGLLRDVCERHGFPGFELSGAAMRAIQVAEWRGNVRELAHAVEAAAIRAAGEGHEGLELRHVFPERAADDEEDGPRTYQDATRRFQRDLLAETLEETEWNVAESARRLDLARSYVYTLIESFGLKRSDRVKRPSGE